MANFLKHSSGNMAEEATTGTSAGAGDSGKLIHLDAGGLIDETMLPSTFGSETFDCIADGALAAGDFVNIYDDSTVPTARLADASDISTQCVGFVLAAVADAATATVYLEGTNDQVSGLTPGTEYYLSATTAGGVETAPEAGTGNISQRVGRSTSATKISLERSNPIILA